MTITERQKELYPNGINLNQAKTLIEGSGLIEESELIDCGAAALACLLSDPNHTEEAIMKSVNQLSFADMTPPERKLMIQFYLKHNHLVEIIALCTLSRGNQTNNV